MLLLFLQVAWEVILPQRAAAEEGQLTVYSVRAQDPLTPYRIVAKQLQSDLTNKGLDAVVLVDTEGSLDTLLSLEQSRGQAIGIVQGDVLYHYLHGDHSQFPQPRSETRVRALARLFPEWLFIETSPSGDVLLSDADRVAYVGALGSGTLVTVQNVSRLLSLDWKSVRFDGFQPELVLADKALSFRMLSPRTGMEQARGSVGPANRRTFLTRASARILASSFPNVYSVVDSKSLRKRLSGTIPDAAAALSCMAVLVGTRGLSDDMVGRVLSVLDEWDSEWKGRPRAELLGYCEPPDTDESVRIEHVLASTAYGDVVEEGRGRQRGLPIATHRLVRVRNLDDPFSRVLITYVSEGVLELLLLIPLLVWAILYFHRMHRDVTQGGPVPLSHYGAYMVNPRNRRWMIFLAGYVLAHLVVATMVWLHEYYSETGQAESKLASGGWPGAVQWIFQNATLGRSESSPESTAAFIWLGLLKMGYAVTGVVVSLLISGQILKNMKGGGRVRDHVIIIGSNAYRDRIVCDLKEQLESLRPSLPGGDRPNVHVLEETSADVKAETKYLRGVAYHYNSDLADSLRRAEFSRARAVIVLSTPAASLPGDQSGGDGWALRVLTRVRQFEQELEKGGAQVPRKEVVVELEDPQNRMVALTLGADDVVSIRSFGAELLAHAAVKPGIPGVFRRLLQTTGDSNELYLLRLDAVLSASKGDERNRPASFLDLKVIHEAGHLLWGEGSSVLLLGLMRQRTEADGKPRDDTTEEFPGESWTPLLNPTGKGGVIRRGDQLIVLARRQPEWRTGALLLPARA